MSTFVPLGGAECAIRVPIGSIEWHAAPDGSTVAMGHP